jgi:hypothetical protein
MLFVVLQAIAAYFFHCGLSLTKHPEGLHLVGGVGFADLAHGEAHVDQYPIAGNRRRILQEAQIYRAPHTYDINDSLQCVMRVDLDDLSWYR